MNEAPKHTEGPWHVERDDHFGPGYVIVSHAAGMHNRAPVVRLTSPLMETDETLKADAYLIASAPEMLAALIAQEAADEANEVRLNYTEWQALEDKAKALRIAAISRAQGPRS